MFFGGESRQQSSASDNRNSTRPAISHILPPRPSATGFFSRSSSFVDPSGFTKFRKALPWTRRKFMHLATCGHPCGIKRSINGRAPSAALLGVVNNPTGGMLAARRRKSRARVDEGSFYRCLWPDPVDRVLKLSGIFTSNFVRTITTPLLHQRDDSFEQLHHPVDTRNLEFFSRCASREVIRQELCLFSLTLRSFRARHIIPVVIGKDRERLRSLVNTTVVRESYVRVTIFRALARARLEDYGESRLFADSFNFQHRGPRNSVK